MRTIRTRLETVREAEYKLTLSQSQVTLLARITGAMSPSQDKKINPDIRTQDCDELYAAIKQHEGSNPILSVDLRFKK